MSPEHGHYDPPQQKWFCGYWMSQEEWFDVHSYSPPTLLQDEDHEPAAEEDKE